MKPIPAEKAEKRAKTETLEKETRLHIRTSSQQKALLMQAARVRHLNVSQFVLQTCLEVAERVIHEKEVVENIPVSAAEMEWLLQKLEEPPQELPALRRLLNEAPVWND